MSRYPANIITKSPATPTGPTTAGRAPGVWRLDEVAYWVKQGVWPNANIAAPDTYFPYVSLLLSTTALGNANNNLFVDSSGAFNPIARNGNATQGSFTPYGASWSNYFDGSGDYLSAPSNTALDCSTGDWTFECWVYVATRTTNYPLVFGNNRGSFTTDALAITASNSDNASYNDKFVFAWGSGGWSSPSAGSAYLLVADVTNSKNTWYHLAVVRSGTSVKMYRNGTQIASATVSAGATFNWGYTNALLGGGNWDGANSYFNGNISNARLVKGTAVYTAAFTPPTSPLTAISGTSLLTCQSNRFRDASTNNFTITANGDTKVQSFSPFAPAYPGITYNQSDIQYWSGYFDGTGDYLTVPDDAALDFGTGDFTIEMWINAQNLSSIPMFFHKGTSVSTGWFFQTSGSTLYFGQLDSARYSTWSVSLTNNAWYHIALTRVGAVLNVFVNGVSQGAQTVTNANLSNDNTGLLYIGEYINGTYLYQGYLSNYRVVKGTAVYTSNFTPSTTPLTAISGTSLLTCQSAAFTDNSTNNFVVTIAGNTTVTGSNPFQAGYYSNYFDGSGDYFTVPYTTANFDWYTAGVDFTIECWINLSTLSVSGFGQPLVVGNYDYGSSTNYWSFGPLANGTVQFYYFNGSQQNVTSTATVTTNSWNHIAMTKTSSGITVYVNGVAGTTTAISGTPQSSTGTPLGVGGFNGAVLTGYVSNLRIVRGTAIYSGNFTVPTSPLTAVTNTKLLTCQSARFIDNSTNNLTLTVTGNTSIQSFDPFYTSTTASNGGSMYFDGTGDYLQSNQPSYALGSGDWTVDFWFYAASNWTAATYDQIVGTIGTDASTGGWRIGSYFGGNGRTLWFTFSNGSYNDIWAAANISDGAWHHIAVVRNGTTVRLYRDGVQTASGTCTVNFTKTNLLVARTEQSGYSGETQCLVSNLRIIKGTCLYPSGTTFTPPTTPTSATSATTFLVNGMNAGAYDATAINNMETVGNAQVSTTQAKFGTTSVYFDGSGDYLVAPSSPAYAFGTGNFTLEGWFYPTASANQALFEMRNSTTSTSGIAVRLLSSSNTLRVIMNNTALFTTSTAVSLNQWSHIAVVRSSGTVTAYLNGVAMTGGSASGSTSLTDNTLWIGELRDGSFQWNGYMDDLRITNGVARYTTNFTAPTQAFTPY